MNCSVCICGPVRNCAPYLDKVLKNIEELSKLFVDYKIIIVYDPSDDNSLAKLLQYQKKNPQLILFINSQLISKYRTHRIAYARNKCLEYVYNSEKKYDYFIMMDFDDVNCKIIRPNILNKYLNEPIISKWDALSFNTNPMYYDIWGLSIYPFCFSYNHFTNNKHNNYNLIQAYINKQLDNLKEDELLQCISSFNGFSIYKTDKFINCKYDGNVRIDLLPKHLFYAHLITSKGKFITPNFGHIDAKYEDCEHRAFHMEAINKNKARIMISSDKLFI